MSQRNPMNDRYQTDEHRGQTRKSAAAMKPKSKAAASVRVQPKEKTKQQKKAEKKVARQKQSDLDRKYYNPPTPQYKRLRKIWWALLIGAIAATALSWVGRSWFPDAVSYVMLGAAYVCIIGALYVDFSKIRKVRRAYQEQMEASKSKEQRALEKQQKAAQKAQKAEAAEAPAEEEKPKKRGLFGSGFRLSKAEQAKAEKQEADAADGGEGNAAFERGKANDTAAADAAKSQSPKGSKK